MLLLLLEQYLGWFSLGSVLSCYVVKGSVEMN